MKLFTAALALTVATASAEIRTVEARGEFRSAVGGDWFGFDYSTPYTLTLQYSTEAPDLSADPLLGIYRSDLPFELSFADRIYATRGTEVRVYAGYGGLWGFTFGVAFAFQAEDGFTVADYSGYGSAISPFLESQAQTPNDSLSNLLAGAHVFGPNGYVTLEGSTPEGRYTRIQDGYPTTYEVGQVPEGNAFALLSFAILLMLLPRFR